MPEEASLKETARTAIKALVAALSDRQDGVIAEVTVIQAVDPLLMPDEQFMWFDDNTGDRAMTNRAEVATFLGQWLAAFPDLQAEWTAPEAAQITDDGYFECELAFTGTHQGPFALGGSELMPAGAKLSFSAVLAGQVQADGRFDYIETGFNYGDVRSVIEAAAK